jgi:hypothetical protein
MLVNKTEISPAIMRFIDRASQFGWENTETNSTGMKFKRTSRPRQQYGWSASRKH